MFQLESKAPFSTTEFWASRCVREAREAKAAAEAEVVASEHFLEETKAALAQAQHDVTLEVLTSQRDETLLWPYPHLS